MSKSSYSRIARMRRAPGRTGPWASAPKRRGMTPRGKTVPPRTTRRCRRLPPAGGQTTHIPRYSPSDFLRVSVRREGIRIRFCVPHADSACADPAAKTRAAATSAPVARRRAAAPRPAEIQGRRTLEADPRRGGRVIPAATGPEDRPRFANTYSSTHPRSSRTHGGLGAAADYADSVANNKPLPQIAPVDAGMSDSDAGHSCLDNVIFED